MFRTALRGVAAHKLRLLTTGFAVMLGVAFMAGTLVLTDTLQRTFDNLFADVYESTDAVVRAEEAFENPEGWGGQRGRIDASLLDDVAAVDGVSIAQGDVFGFAQLLDKDGEAIGNPDTGAPTFGGNWSVSDELNAFTLVAGREPRTDSEIVIDKASADDAGYRVGDDATVMVKGPPLQATIAGIVKFGEVDSPGGASFVMFTPEAAQRFVGEPGRFDSISVVADDGVSQSEIVRRLDGILPDQVEAVTGEAITEENQDAFREGMSFFSTFMLVFAVVALIVGGFMIFNTFFITVAQRTRENALMRAIGASKRQVLGSILLEAVVVGIVASLLGLAAGVVVASGLKALLGAIGFDLPGGGVVFTSGTALWSFGAGLAITVVAAVSPARKAGKVPPVAAMRDVSVGSTGYGSKERIIVSTAVVTAGVAALFWGLFGDASNALLVVGLGMLLVLFGVTFLGRTVALPLSRVLGSPLPKARGITGELARENAMRNPKRTAATASTLMIGVALVVFFSILAASTKTSIDRTIEESFTGDVAVTGGTTGFGGLDPSLAKELNELPEVESATGVRRNLAEIDGTPTSFMAADPATAFDIIDVDPIEGSPSRLDGDAIAVFEDEANEEGLHLGDRVPVRFKDTGVQQLTVELIFGAHIPDADWIVGMPVYEANFEDQFDTEIYVENADGVPSATALAAIERAADRYGNAEVLDRAGYVAQQSEEVDQLLGLIYALLAFAILIALLGIGNTLALSILERTREVGVLRAVGMTRSQLRSTIRWESVIIAVQGTLLGLAVGVFFGWALVRALRDEGITTFDPAFGSLVVIVALAAVAGVVAAVMPARRAARMNVLEAIVSD